MNLSFRHALMFFGFGLGVLIAAEPIPVTQQLADLKGRFKAQYDIEIRSAQADDKALSASYDITPVADANLAGTVKVLGWVEEELKRYPAGFLKHHGPRQLVLAESFLSKRPSSGVTPVSPSSLDFKAAEAIALTVPAKLTAVQEFFKGRHIHQTLIGFLLQDHKAPADPISFDAWKKLPKPATASTSPIGKRLAGVDSRAALFGLLWDPFEHLDLIAEAKVDASVAQKLAVMKDFLATQDKGFDQAFFNQLTIIPESQRIVCTNDLTDLGSVDLIKKDAEIQADLRLIEKKWGITVLWAPGSPAPPMPAKVRLVYSYFTDKKIVQFKAFVRMLREELDMYPDAIVSRLGFGNIYILDEFTYRDVKLAGQSFSWIPKPAVAYGLNSFKPEDVASRAFFSRTTHHEVFHAMERQFTTAGGPLFGANWDMLNEDGFRYRIGPNSVSADGQPTHTKDNKGRKGFAEPYGTNFATDDRATLYARMMVADQIFYGRLPTDPILLAKTKRLQEFFLNIRHELSVPESSPLYQMLARTPADAASAAPKGEAK
ncbi:hypothetical protein LBMAG55_19260 [Verrucomicrobiota bacterium]|nr:hypothetical protein LBMAG55_19260 [Verrucomicrobiota bacterium]